MTVGVRSEIKIFFHFISHSAWTCRPSIISKFIIQSLSPEDYRYVMKTVESAILSTDLAMYFKKRDNFLNLIDNGEFDFGTDESKQRKLKPMLLCFRLL